MKELTMILLDVLEINKQDIAVIKDVIYLEEGYPQFFHLFSVLLSLIFLSYI